jgi:multisubunit Na+/H+ antiporter MnhE subunit
MRAVVEVLAWWPVLVLVWLATLNSYSSEELVTAAALALPCAVAARAARRAAGVHWTFRPKWARWLLALPPAVGHDTAGVLLLAMKRSGVDRFREVPMPEHPDGGQEATATAILSATPGSVVVDAHDNVLLVHSVPIGRTRLEREISR